MHITHNSSLETVTFGYGFVPRDDGAPSIDEHLRRRAPNDRKPWRTDLASKLAGGRVQRNAAIPAEEVVWGLMRAGFAITQRAASATVLERGNFVVAIPTVSALPPEALAIILRDAGIDEERFLDLFGDAPTERSSVV